jgi:hypothetical protein
MTYEGLKKFICETYDIYSGDVAWAFNIGYLDCLTDNTDHLKHSELNELIRMNSELREEKSNEIK